MHFDAVITKEGKLYSSWCPQLDIASSGRTIEEARSNLKVLSGLSEEEFRK